MIKRIKINPETEIKMLYDQLDVKEAMIKSYTAEIETQRKQLAIAVEALETYAQDKDCWEDVREECKLILKKIKELNK